ncbi:MAG: PD-(D/E)XK nuclease domain-containing protein, partial [Deltaproteobacteria bacterium]|nr:PD-(D/E)XK nuclease domain-containing protein [Deltaproteobacteria bacterium]
KEFGAFWFRTGTPTFLTHAIQRDPAGYSAFKDGNVIAEDLDKVDIGKFAPIPLMFQTGYLTVSEIKWLNKVRHFVLRTPNGEVLSSLLPLLTYSTVDSSKIDEIKRLATDIRDALKSTNPTALEVAFHNLLSCIPYIMHSSYEGYYQTVFFLALNSINQSMELEKSTGDGTPDAIVKIGGDVFVIEFKYVKAEEETIEANEEVSDGQGKRKGKKPTKKKSSPDHLTEMLNKSVSAAMEQIESKNYADMHLSSGRANRVFKIAVAVAGRTKVKSLFKEIERPDGASA